MCKAGETSGAISNIDIACPIHMYIVRNSPGLLYLPSTCAFPCGKLAGLAMV